MHVPKTAWRVLLAAHGSKQRETIADALRGAPALSLDEAQEPDDAMRRLDQEHYDAIISEHPARMNTGDDLLETAKQRFPTTRRILLTPHPSLDAIVAALHAACIHAVLPCDAEPPKIVELVTGGPA